MPYGNLAVDTLTTSTGQIIGASSSATMKNRIINGAMVIDQRNAGASITPTTDGVYSIDRWRCGLSVTSKFSVQQNAGSVTPPTGFTNYLGVTSLSAYTVGASENFRIQQSIEGFNTADLAWGTANAQTVTLSFWVRSSLTGTFGGAIKNSAETRVYPFTYTINSSNTWEYKTVTIPGDITGTWVGATNGIGLSVHFNLGTGSTLNGTAGAWQGGNLFSATGATSVVGTSGATFYITGVQLEVGASATSFDYRHYGTELALCQRYYEQLNLNNGSSDSVSLFCFNRNSTLAWCIWNFMVPKRVAPTTSTNGGYGWYHFWGADTEVGPTWNLQPGAINHTAFTVSASGLSAGYSGILSYWGGMTHSSNPAIFYANAEL
jgi:hypothetical protein